MEIDLIDLSNINISDEVWTSVRIEMPNKKYILSIPTVWIDLSLGKVFLKSPKYEANFMWGIRHQFGTCQILSNHQVRVILQEVEEEEIDREKKKIRKEERNIRKV